MSAIASLFYTATILALVFFVHKVLWLVRYKRLQAGLVERAVSGLLDEDRVEIREWDEFAKKCWTGFSGDKAVTSPVDFIERVEERLAKFRAEIKASRRSIENTLSRALAEGRGTPELVAALVLSLRRLSKEARDRVQVTIDLSFPEVVIPTPPDKKLYELDVSSRYGFWRRALVFFSGAADVVYSSHHVARMSQNVHVPVSVLMRRLSLVFLVLGAVMLDWAFGFRASLAAQYDGWLDLHPAARGAGFFDQNLGAALAFVTWLAGYGCVYLLVYFAIRRRYQASKKRLEDLKAREAEILISIRQKHIDELVSWARSLARGLDKAVDITLRHADTLVDHAAAKARRRVAARALVDGARAIADALFTQLPESIGGLQDVATTHKHSIQHWVWPRAEEMEYQVRLTQYRAAWQHIELAVGGLMRERPDPREAHQLWRSCVAYASMFQKLVPQGTAARLKIAYKHMVEECVSETEADLEELDRRVAELARSLNEQLMSARPLVVSKVELANQQIEAATAALSAEIIGVREQARLEAMAFEI